MSDTIYFIEALLPSGNILTLRSTARLPLNTVTDLEIAGLIDAQVETLADHRARIARDYPQEKPNV